MHPGQVSTMNCSPKKCWPNHLSSLVSGKSDGSQSFTSFFICWSDILAPRIAKGTAKNTITKISSACRAKKVGFM